MSVQTKGKYGDDDAYECPFRRHGSWSMVNGNLWHGIYNNGNGHTRTHDGKKSAIEIDSSIWREEIGNRNNRLVNLAGRRWLVDRR